jgi:choloylglycine hydrolase
MPKKKIVSLAVASSLCFGLISNTAVACSRVLYHTDKETIVGRTMDLYTSDEAKIVVYPRGLSRDGATTTGVSKKWVSKYGSVTAMAFDAGSSDGVNEKGLVANLLYLHDTQYEARDTRPGVANMMILQYLLDNAATVNEALEELKKIQVTSAMVHGREWPLHISISDAHGDSAVIEFIKGAMVVHQGKETAVMTNEPPLDWQLNNLKRYKYFGGKDPLPGDIDPASRFARASAFLKTNPVPKDNVAALAQVYGIMKTVSSPHGAINTSDNPDTEDTWPTLWTSLIDSTNKLYYFQAANSPNMFWIDMKKINFAKGNPIKAIPAYDASLSGEISARLKPIKIVPNMN